MKKKLLLLPMFLLASLASCGQTNEPASQPTGLSSSSQPAAAKALDFIKTKGQARFDVMTEKLGVTFSYGNSVEIKTESIGAHYFTIANDTAITVSGTLAAETVNFVVVTEKGEGTTAVSIYPGILKDSLAEFLGDFAKTNIEGNDKVYIAVSGGSDILWNKNESTIMNDLIQAKVDIIK